jgi:hypothetical protein
MLIVKNNRAIHYQTANPKQTENKKQPKTQTKKLRHSNHPLPHKNQKQPKVTNLLSNTPKNQHKP